MKMEIITIGLAIATAIVGVLLFIWRETKKSTTESVTMNMTLNSIKDSLTKGESTFKDHSDKIQSHDEKLKTHGNNLKQLNNKTGLTHLNEML
jgi:hypothetical protein